MDAELAISRDGLHWQRPFRSPYFLPRGEPGSFDHGSILTNAAPVFLEDEVRFYYGGYAEGATGGDDIAFKTGVGMASMPRDRFAGLRPIEGLGNVVLKPVELTGCREITLNADAKAGRVEVELLNAEGYRVRGYAREDAAPITGDGLRLPVRWQTKTLADLPAGSYCLRVFLQNADLYAVTLAQ
jgi:hypothetical protein